jgi:uncharacterized protein with PIN domain
MSFTTLRFYAELNEYIPAEFRGKDIFHAVSDGEQVIDMLQAFGVPPEKVDLILKNGVSVSATEPLLPGDRLSVYPVFESMDIREVVKIRARPLRNPGFILDVHLGKLASYLRMLGFDAALLHDATDEQLLDISLKEERALLSKDRKLHANPLLTRKYRVLSDDVREQLLEILNRFDLFSSIAPFTRCIRCNTILAIVAKEKILDRLPPKAVEYYDEYTYCAPCDRIYWKGSHYREMKQFIDEIRREKIKV